MDAVGCETDANSLPRMYQVDVGANGTELRCLCQDGSYIERAASLDIAECKPSPHAWRSGWCGRDQRCGSC